MTKAIAQSPRDIQRRAMLLVYHEIHVCVSSLVSTLANNALLVARTRGGNELSQLIDKAAELAAPVLDHESAAREAGWDIEETTCVDSGNWYAYRFEDGRKIIGSNQFEDKAMVWQDLCEAQDIEPHESEVYKHWAVSEWLGERLTARGERVDMDFSGLHIWARTATGQGIAMDDVIQRITSETGYASGA